jgi:hypothetical protein
MALAALLRLFYAWYTRRTWEDGLITVQHSEDFVRGIGLTHPVPAGEGPLHGFTSPLSVLIPLLGDLMHLGFGITFLRLVSVVAAPVAVLCAVRIALALKLPPIVSLAAGAFLAIEYHQILWGMAGMETQVVTLCYLAVLLAFLEGTQGAKGIALGFAMLARPDAAFLVLIALAFEVWRLAPSRNWKPLLPIGAGLFLLYGPWLIFTTLYYGSPIPNTIIAKGLGYPTVLSTLAPLSLFAKLLAIKSRVETVLQTLGPAYGGHGTGFLPLWDHYRISLLMMILLAAGLVIALRRRHEAALFVYAFVLTYDVYLAFAANRIFGWYTVPITAAAILCSFYGAWNLLETFAPQHTRQPIVIVYSVCYLACIAAVLPQAFHSDKYVQHDIEFGVRRTMGRYLHDVSYPTDTIASESLGYVGYYSGRIIYDYPGLCSRPVVHYLRNHPAAGDHSLVAMAQSLQPTYLVLRPLDLPSADTPALPPGLADTYDLVKVFEASPDAQYKILFPDHNIDRVFYVYRHKGAPHHDPPIPLLIL